MSLNNLQVLKIISGVTAGIFSLLSAILYFWEALQDNNYGKTREWFRRKWVRISNSKWISMPERAIEWFLDSINYLKNFVINLTNKFPKNYFILCYIIFFIIIFGGIAREICREYGGDFFYNFFIMFSALYISNSLVVTKPINPPKYLKILYDLISWNLAGPLSIIDFLTLLSISWICFVFLLLYIDIYFTVIITLLSFPFLFLCTGFSLGFIIEGNSFISRYSSSGYFPFTLGFSFMLSIFITLFALMVGHIASPSAYLPQTFQMLFSNVICDGLTMVATILILSKIVKGDHLLLKIPVAILIDIFIAALLAISSLYFGLVFTKNALSIKEILYILIAKSPQGNTIELGPYFWAMHTTFLPTIFYLSVILVCWVGKALLIPVRWFFGVGKEHSSPLKLTAALSGVFAAFFGALFGLIQLL